ncbi:MAG: hypothetical protein KGJ41_06275 [Rhodospirillales bacterium]|nr:hypothetical protein [Rhodospirillales bacterium]MDE2198608.1 hypothetical protein [Rhodospirillales bacterium]MDE2577094.1 hypothetical protein [Rhodospirillales bacterium]
MRTLPALLLAAFVLPTLAFAAPAPKKPVAKAVHPAAAAASTGPRSIGVFGDWQAATYSDGGQGVCYAFTRAAGAPPATAAVLTVSERPGARDSVAITTPGLYPANAALSVHVDKTVLDFYTAQHSAFARDGRIAVAAFHKGSAAIAPSGAKSEDRFSLKGFSAAYGAILKACPAK